ncbi:MAG: PQQ-dependent sugar dehydrogenase [Acidimicrobiales bacterium]|nr:PQQ-dependent sugar dehydrogenase [Acidimicrobiales bacterium]
MTRLSGTTRFMFFALVTIAVIAILRASAPNSERSIDRRDEIWWRSTTETSTPSQDSREFELSNERCPNDIPLLEPKQVESVDLELSLFLDLPGAIALVFLDAETGFIAERNGLVYAFDSEGVLADPVINMTSDTSNEMDQGLLGLAISPDMNWLYLNRTDLSGSSVVTAHSLRSGTPHPGAGIEIIVVDQPSAMHNGGDLAFDSEGRLLVSFGDGGGLGDPYGHGQNLSTPLGAVLRLDVNPNQWPPHKPAIGNPDHGPGSDPRIWVSGVRNPFRFSFDESTGDLWLTDLGQQCVEELNVLTSADSGANLGWNLVEGSRPFLGRDNSSLRGPDFQYRHGRGRCAIIGGFVVHGGPHPILEGRYLFTDMCGAQLMALQLDEDPSVLALPLHASHPVAFAAGHAQDLYLIDLASGVWQISLKE